MPTLTIDAIRENPWNAVDLDIPVDPNSDLLEIAYVAAHFCEEMEFSLMQRAFNGEYVPEGYRIEPWSAVLGIKQRHRRAVVRLSEISKLHERRFGEPLEPSWHDIKF